MCPKSPIIRYFVVIFLPDLLLSALLALPNLPQYRSFLGRLLPGLVLLCGIFALPMLFGGFLFVWMLLGGVWGSLPGLRWRTLIAYTLLTLFALPLPYIISAWSATFPGWWLVWLNGQRALGFAFGGWYQILDNRINQKA